MVGRSNLQCFRSELEDFVIHVLEPSFNDLLPGKNLRYYTSETIQDVLYANRANSISSLKQMTERTDRLKALIEEGSIDPRYLNIPFCYSEKGQLHLKTPLGDLTTLSQDVRELIKRQGPEHIAAQLIYAVGQLHKNNLVHRDIDLSNVLLYQTQEGKLYIKLSELDETSNHQEFIDIYKTVRTPPEIKRNGKINVDLFQMADKKKIDAYLLGGTLIKFLDMVNPEGHEESKQVLKIRKIAEKLQQPVNTRLSVTDACDELFSAKKFTFSWFCKKKKTIIDEWLGIIPEPMKAAKSEDLLSSSELAFYDAAKSFEEKYHQHTLNPNDTLAAFTAITAITASRNLHVKAVEVLTDKPRDQRFIDNVRSIQAKNNRLLELIDKFGLCVTRDHLIEIVKRAIVCYDVQNQLTKRNKNGRYWFFNCFRTVGIQNANNLLEKCRAKSTKQDVYRVIKDHLEHGPGGNSTTSFKTILRQELEAYIPPTSLKNERNFSLR